MNDLVLAVPTYNTLEYLKVFIESYDRYASNHKLVVVCDGSTDGTKEFLWLRPDITKVVFEKNVGKPKAYNACLRTARGVCSAKYVFILNDDMVLGPNWDKNLGKWKPDLDVGSLVLVNYVEPFEGTSAGFSYYPLEVLPEHFDLDLWAEFETNLHNQLLGDPEEIIGMGPGMPYIISSEMIDKYPYDERFSVPCGCQDGDFLLRLYLDGYKIFRIKKNMVFHFSMGANKKIKEAGLWVSGGQLFKDKWGISLGEAINIFHGDADISEEQKNILRKRGNLNV